METLRAEQWQPSGAKPMSSLAEFRTWLERQLEDAEHEVERAQISLAAGVATLNAAEERRERLATALAVLNEYQDVNP